MKLLKWLLLALLLSVVVGFYQEHVKTTSLYFLDDGNGCPLRHYPISGGVVAYNPLVVARYAKSYFEMREDGWRSKFLHCIEILERHLQERNGLLLVIYKFSWPKYDLPANWSSCMAQSSAIVAFHYAYLVTGNVTYENISDRLIDAFFVEVKKGGLAYDTGEGLWYEEYAHPNMKQRPYVLNGFMYSLLELHQAYELKGDRRLKALFDRGIKALLSKIDEFDTGYWSKYDLVGTISPWKYHWVHIEELEQLYNMTGDLRLKEWADKWRSYVFSLAGVSKWTIHTINGFRIWLAKLPLPSVVLLNLVISALLLKAFSFTRNYLRKRRRECSEHKQ